MTTTTFDFEITNSCTCIAPYDCLGYCWDESLYQFFVDLENWFIPGTYRIDNFPVWNGKLTGWFDAENLDEFLNYITPDRTEWILRYSVPEIGKPFEAILSHHDAPTGGRISVYLDNESEFGNE